MATILAMPSPIEIYQDMSALSAGMVEAARTQDWERLVDLERSVIALRKALINNDDNASLSSAERELKAVIIRRILDDDAEVRCHTEPWMEHVRQYLGDSARRRSVQKAYSAGAGEHAPGSYGA